MKTKVTQSSDEANLNYDVIYKGFFKTRFTDYASYRVAVGFKFDAEAPIAGVKHVVSQLLLGIQRSLLEKYYPHVAEEFPGEALFEVDSQSGAARAILLWKDHPCLARDVSCASEDVAEASSLAFISVCEILEGIRSLQPILEFTLVAEELISDESSYKLDRYLADGTVLFEATHEYLI